MKKQEFQKLHGFDDQDMDNIVNILNNFDGNIVAIHTDERDIWLSAGALACRDGKVVLTTAQGTDVNIDLTWPQAIDRWLAIKHT